MIIFFNYFYCFLAVLVLIVGNLAVFGFQYTLLDGVIFLQGSNNELFCPIFILILFLVYSQTEVTMEEVETRIYKHEEGLERRRSS